jgi:hypothetical protein
MSYADYVADKMDAMREAVCQDCEKTSIEDMEPEALLEELEERGFKVVVVRPKVGFTGPREGMSDRQKKFLASFIRLSNPAEFHHGDCVGADAEAHDIMRENSDGDIWIHPPINPKLRAFKSGDFSVEEKEYKERNRSIVNSVKVLIGTPRGLEKNQPRSGTWYTIRYARKAEKKVIVINA